jgi:HSP20 family protein
MRERESKLPAGQTTRSELVDPFSGWPPFDSLRREVDRLFDRFDGGFWRLPFRHRQSALDLFWGAQKATFPATDVAEKEQAYEITAELPGLDLKDVDIKLSNGYLIISGEKREEKEEKRRDYHLSERHYGAFERSFLVPDSVDAEKISAQFDKGVLTVTLPKKPSAQTPERRIEIEAK